MQGIFFYLVYCYNVVTTLHLTSDIHTNEALRAWKHTYNHVVADVTERGFLEDVLHEAVSCRVYLQRVTRLGARRRRRSTGDGWRDRRDGEVGGVRWGHPNVAEMARAAADV